MKEAPIPQDRPVYRILSEKGYFGPDDTLYVEGSVIVLYDKPNEDMEPMNDIARKAYDSYIDELEKGAQAVASMYGRSYSGRPRSKEEAIAFASEDARRVQLVQGGPGVPLMGARKQSNRRIQKVGDKEAPDTSRKTKRANVEVVSIA